MSKWNYGCGCKVTVYTPRGYTYRAMEKECGSTGHDGEVVQCDTCATRNPAPAAREFEDYGYDD